MAPRPKEPKPKPTPKSQPRSPGAGDASRMYPNAKPRAGGASGYAYTPPGGSRGTGAPGATQAQKVGAGVGGMLPAAYEDPYGGLSALELMMYGNSGMFGDGSGGSGGRGGGGSVAPVDPDPMGWNAIARQQGLEAGYGNMLKALDEKAAADAAGFASRGTGLNTARDAGAAQLQGILADSQARTGVAQQAVQGSYQQGDQNLQNIMGQYAQMQAARQPGMQNTLQAFGADPGAVQPSYGVQDMVTAQRASMAGRGQADDALFAGRGAVYNGLNSDVATQQSQSYQGLNAKLLADKQAADAAAASQRAQLAMQLQQQILEVQANEQARKAGYQ